MSNFYNEVGEPLMDGVDMRREMMADAYDVPEFDDFNDSWDEPTCDDVDEDDVDSEGRVWCYGCDGYADHTVAGVESGNEDAFIDASEA